MAHDWPGNVRELRNLLDRSIALSPGAESVGDLRFLHVDGPAISDPLSVQGDLPWAQAKQNVIEAFEKRYLEAILREADGNLSEASRRSGLDRKQLRTLAKKHNLLR